MPSLTQQYYLLCPYHERRCKCSANRRPTAQALQLSLDSRETRLQSRFLYVASNLAGQEEWYGHVLRRIGSEDGLDHAAQAIIKAYGMPNPGALKGYANYHRSMAALQSACQKNKVSNADLLTVALCFLYEIRANAVGSVAHIHGDGIAAMLTSRQPSHWRGNIARTIFYASSTSIFHNNVVHGKESPFDDSDWINMTPSSTSSSSMSTLRLRHLAQILLIRLPRLILQVREYSCASSHNSSARLKMVELFDELLAISDDNAHQQALDDLDFHDSQQPAIAKHYKSSYHFKDHAHFQALTLWWTMRLILLRLHSKIHASTVQDQIQPLIAPVPLQNRFAPEKRRLCEHILRSLQYTLLLPMMSRWPYMSAIQPAFGALEDAGMDLSSDAITELQSTLIEWYGWFLRGLNMPQQEPTVLRLLSEMLAGEKF